MNDGAGWQGCKGSQGAAYGDVVLHSDQKVLGDWPARAGGLLERRKLPAFSLVASLPACCTILLHD
jgi:hypothetical protein